VDRSLQCHNEPSSGFLLGDCLPEKVNALYWSPIDRFSADYDEVIERLWAINPLDAIKFGDFVLGSSTRDRALDNTLSIFQLVGVPLVARFNQFEGI